jgi:hypothetical protein
MKIPNDSKSDKSSEQQNSLRITIAGRMIEKCRLLHYHDEILTITEQPKRVIPVVNRPLSSEWEEGKIGVIFF